MLKINLQIQALVVQLNTKVNQAQGQVAASNQMDWQAQEAAQSAANVDHFRPAAPPKYGDKKKDEHVSHWIPVIEDYLRTCDVTRGPRLYAPWPSHIKYTTRSEFL
jgi:hypothetical protein